MNAEAHLGLRASLMLFLIFSGCMKPVTLNGSVYENPTYQCPVELLTEVRDYLQSLKKGGVSNGE